MIVKLVRFISEQARGCYPRSGNKECPVVPTHTHVFDCLEVKYRKYLAKDLGDAIELMGNTSHEILPYDPGFDSGPFEFLMVSVKSSEDKGWENYFAPDYSLYILNDKGKTVDSIHCVEVKKEDIVDID